MADLRFHLKHTRRKFIGTVCSFGAFGIGASPAFLTGCQRKKEDEEKVSANEDLMREHGILKRVLLAYEEMIRRIGEKKDFSPQAVLDGATIIRKFIEDYHEKLEEDYLFPRFRKAGKLVDLVNTLQNQHEAGRRVTDRILTMAASLQTQDDRNRLGIELEAFRRMYAPHEAREDTVLFPELHKIVSPNEYDSMGEEFEKIERKTFGEDGFEMYVNKVATLEKQLGVDNLSQFTPR